ncbi:MAG: hypothetical protein KY444_01825, partial [Gemmatimonadetes bacterium]|nr:hypothetical protein [Gemmatimonadota bacterium]
MPRIHFAHPRRWPVLLALLLLSATAASAGLRSTGESGRHAAATVMGAPEATPARGAAPDAPRIAAGAGRNAGLAATTITVEPGGKKVPVNSARVRITYKDPEGFQVDSITLRGRNLWHVSPTPENFTVVSKVTVYGEETETSEAYVEATLPLVEGPNVLVSYTCPWTNKPLTDPCVTRADTFTYDPNMDVDPPSAGFTPGSYSRVYEPSLPVTVQWQDNRVLIPSTLQATLNGSAVALSYVSTDSAHGTLSGTLALRDGANELQARMCDREGNCGTATARYVLARTPQRPPPPLTDSAQTSPGMVLPGTQIRRDMCLTIAAGAGASYECGHLRLAHALPASRVFSTATAPVLVYNSDDAHPTPVLPFNLGMEAGKTPSSVTAILRVGPAGGALVERKRATWSDAGWSTGGIWRFALSYDASDASTSTGVYAYQVEVLGNFAGTERQMAVYAGEMAIVNRAASPFGAGWWLAGLDQLLYVPSDGSWLLVGGDGSTRRYSWIGPGVWRSAAADRPDTLWAYGSAEGSYYHRRLPNGTRVWYNPQHRQSSTESRLGRVTRFHHNETTGRLDSISLPTPSAGLRAGYRFSYDGSRRLWSACAYATNATCRAVTVQHGLNDARITGFTDPDNHSVGFGYPGAERRVSSRTDRRKAVTNFAYGDAGRLRESWLDVPEAQHTIRHRFSPGETRGLAVALPAARAGTVYDAPRTDLADTTTFWLNRWGAPTRVQDALGGITAVTRGDARFPGLVTEAIGMNGLRTLAHYDALGRPDSVVVVNPLGDQIATPADGTTLNQVVPMASAASGDWIIGGLANLAGDAGTDIVWQNRASLQTTAWEMRGTTRVGSVGIAPVESADWEIGGVADMTGDGKPDIVWQNRVTLQTGVWRMDGTTPTEWIPIAPVESSDWQIGGVADMTGDGMADIVWQNRATRQTGIWLMNRTSIAGWVPMSGTESGDWEIGGVAHMAGDASADIIWHNRVTGKTGVWVMNGTSLVGWVELPPAASSDWQIGGAADMTGDGRTDIVWQNRTTSETAVWVMGARPPGRNLLTTYAYDDRWNLPKRVSTFEVSPSGAVAALAGSSEVEYDARGNRLWQQDGRGEASRVAFFYNAAGQITSSRIPSQRLSSGMRDSIEYDGWGNVSRVRTPGGVWTTTHKDALGRDTLVVSPIDGAQTLLQRQRTAYDAMDRVTWTETSAPETDGRNGAQTVRVETDYDAEGAPWKSRRTISPDPNGIGVMWTEWRRDAAGRVTTQLTPGDAQETTAYNPAGQVVAVTPRAIGGRHMQNVGEWAIRMRYDALGRVVSRITPPMVYLVEELNTYIATRSYPLHPLEPGSVSPGRLPGDTAVFVYDRDGNMVVAANRDAVVTRSYYPNGAVRGDTLAVRTYTGADYTRHVYGLEHTYDMAGRRTRLGYPQNVLGTGAAASYTYEPLSGALESVTAPGANRFTFAYNDDGQLDTLSSPAGIVEATAYNADGQLHTRKVTVDNTFTGKSDGLPPVLRSETVWYDARGKIRKVDLGPGEMTNEYAALGALSRAYSTLPSSTQLLTVDALGNTVRDDSRTRNEEGFETRGIQSHRYTTNGTGRLIASSTQEPGLTAKGMAQDTTVYDGAGNRIHYSARTVLRWEEVSGQNGPLQEAVTLDEGTRSYYDAEGRLRATDRRRCVARPVNGVISCVTWEPAPGRDQASSRSTATTRWAGGCWCGRFNETQCGIHVEMCKHRVVRTVRDGDQLLVELRSTGENNLESDAEWVAYTHG